MESNNKHHDDRHRRSEGEAGGNENFLLNSWTTLKAEEQQQIDTNIDQENNYANVVGSHILPVVPGRRIYAKSGGGGSSSGSESDGEEIYKNYVVPQLPAPQPKVLFPQTHHHISVVKINKGEQKDVDGDASLLCEESKINHHHVANNNNSAPPPGAHIVVENDGAAAVWDNEELLPPFVDKTTKERKEEVEVNMAEVPPAHILIVNKVNNSTTETADLDNNIMSSASASATSALEKLAAVEKRLALAQAREIELAATHKQQLEAEKKRTVAEQKKRLTVEEKLSAELGQRRTLEEKNRRAERRVAEERWTAAREREQAFQERQELEQHVQIEKSKADSENAQRLFQLESVLDLVNTQASYNAAELIEQRDAAQARIQAKDKRMLFECLYRVACEFARGRQKPNPLSNPVMTTGSRSGSLFLTGLATVGYSGILDLLDHPAHYTVGFHGTKTVEAICSIFEAGFDPTRRAGQAYGPGEYFDIDKGVVAEGYTGNTGCLIVAVIITKKKDGSPLPQYKEAGDHRIAIVNNPVPAARGQHPPHAFNIPCAVASSQNLKGAVEQKVIHHFRAEFEALGLPR